MLKKLLPILLILVLALTACSGGGDTPSADSIATSVAATLQANATPTNTAAPLTGFVSGSVCYPSEGIPPMTVYLQESGSQTYTAVPIAQNQGSFNAEVPVGSYTAYAWLPDFSIGGSYSQAVPCGLLASCTDHSLITFEVSGGLTTEGVDVCDWYAQDQVPYPPGIQPPSGNNDGGGGGFGSISGALSYPSNFIPSQTIVAWSVENPGTYYYVITAEGSGYYQISNLPAGHYRVVAYVSGGLAAGYTPAVPCGLSVSCTDHSLISVQVTGGQDTGGVNPQDWYAPDGSFPANPAP